MKLKALFIVTGLLFLVSCGSGKLIGLAETIDERFTVVANEEVEVAEPIVLPSETNPGLSAEVTPSVPADIEIIVDTMDEAVDTLDESLVDVDQAGEVGNLAKFYLDADGDGFGDASQMVEGEDMVSGYVLDNTDCDDSNASIHPFASDVAGNFTDEDCSGKPLFVLGYRGLAVAGSGYSLAVGSTEKSRAHNNIRQHVTLKKEMLVGGSEVCTYIKRNNQGDRVAEITLGSTCTTGMSSGKFYSYTYTSGGDITEKFETIVSDTDGDLDLRDEMVAGGFVTHQYTFTHQYDASGRKTETKTIKDGMLVGIATFDSAGISAEKIEPDTALAGGFKYLWHYKYNDANFLTLKVKIDLSLNRVAESFEYTNNVHGNAIKTRHTVYDVTSALAPVLAPTAPGIPTSTSAGMVTGLAGLWPGVISALPTYSVGSAGVAPGIGATTYQELILKDFDYSYKIEQRRDTTTDITPSVISTTAP